MRNQLDTRVARRPKARSLTRRILLFLAIPWLLGVARPDPAVGGFTGISRDGDPRTPAEPPYLFDSGTPATNPYDLCGTCYAWSSTYRQSSSNFDLSARRVTVSTGAYAYAFRLWWAYGAEGPYDPFRNRGGTAGDFSSIGLDLYAADPGGGPGALLTTLHGNWTLLNAATQYREFRPDTPYVFADSVYYVSLRGETNKLNYEAVLLWFACAPHDVPVDYENAQNGFWSSGGWDPYTTDNRPYSPCPQDMDFGLQVLGFAVPNGITPVALEDCLSNGCATISMDFHRVDPTPLRGFSVTFELSPELELCDAPDSIAEGSYLRHVGSTIFQVLSLGGGRYTVDGAILGLPCGAVGVGDLFTLRVRARPGITSGTGTITVTEALARDCANHGIAAVPGRPAHLPIDGVPPAAVAGFTARQLKTGNNPAPPQPALQVTRVQLEFTPPPDAATVEIYRAPYGNYPEYDDPPGPGSPPALPPYPPPSPWSRLTSAATSPWIDRPLARGLWYYVAFALDACGNVSTASMADNPLLASPTPGTLNYHLGDVSQGVPPICTGNNRVFLEDMSLLGAHYGVGEGNPLYLSCVDVGPTVDGSGDARPLTDNLIDFEDLMIFAGNFEMVGLRGGAAGAAFARGPEVGTPVVVFTWDGEGEASSRERTARLWLRGGTRVHGLHARVAFDPADWRLLSVAPGALIDEAGERAVAFDDRKPDGVTFDAAGLGPGVCLPGDGEIAVLRFTAVHGDGPGPAPGESSHRPRLIEVDLRDTANHELPSEAEAAAMAPEASGFLAGERPTLSLRPNPTGGPTEVLGRIPASGPTRLQILDVAGRLVRTLQDAPLPAGLHRWSWDGWNDNGRPVGAGVYFVRLEQGDASVGIKLYRVR